LRGEWVHTKPLVTQLVQGSMREPPSHLSFRRQQKSQLCGREAGSRNEREAGDGGQQTLLHAAFLSNIHRYIALRNKHIRRYRYCLFCYKYYLL
jgi:hypothetical protein